MKYSQSTIPSRVVAKLSNLKHKFLRAYQIILVHLLRSSISSKMHIDYEIAASMLSVAVKVNSEDALKELQRFVQDSHSLHSDPSNIDALVNFSAYWRDEWVAKKAALVPSGSKVLDAGAGQCRYRPLFAHTVYKAQDFAQYQGSRDGPLRETWDYAPLDYVCDITAIPVDTGSFDVVLCTEVLEHVPDPISALREICRVVCEGGSLILSAPLGSGVHQEPFHFYGGFSPYFYEKFLNEFGFDVVEIKPIGGLLRHVAQEVHRAARTIGVSDRILTPERRYLMADWLPRFLSELDEEFFIDQFTVGYLVEGRKRVLSPAQ